ncbi:SMI1/KNR4 family protein [Vibrio sp. S4M6]|uniref:SMI1/KNR4 family protein n=1 Tax=Vibrio sinus TaxID=2946865 RepID=UPI00202A71D5|nr:SMI1/KNR4 family protein [Vibrio sinus]MCL9783418.1 SMI1/KNR4 family protein [Vibrio sinus]
MSSLNKLENLGIFHRNINRSNQKHQTLTRLQGLPLPKAYAEFLARYPDTCFFDKEIGFVGEEHTPFSSSGLEHLDVLYSSSDDTYSDIIDVRALYLDEIPSYYLVIGEVTGGNLICLNLKTGEVTIWDKTVPDLFSNSIFKVADSFSEFLELLKEVVEGDELESKTKVVSFNPSEELDAMMGDYKKKHNLE